MVREEVIKKEACQTLPINLIYCVSKRSFQRESDLEARASLESIRLVFFPVIQWFKIIVKNQVSS